jgi:hypothetical protein
MMPLTLSALMLDFGSTQPVKKLTEGPPPKVTEQMISTWLGTLMETQ